MYIYICIHSCVYIYVYINYTSYVLEYVFTYCSVQRHTNIYDVYAFDVLSIHPAGFNSAVEVHSRHLVG